MRGNGRSQVEQRSWDIAFYLFFSCKHLVYNYYIQTKTNVKGLKTSQFRHAKNHGQQR